MPEETKTEDSGKKPMISAEYRKEFNSKPKDWVRTFVESQCYVTETLPEDSKKKPKTVADVDLMIMLASVNDINVEKFNTDVYNNGQKVMNINNVLRGAARKRHGLKDLEGKFHSIPADDPLIEGTEPSHDQNGNIIAKAAKNENGEPIQKH